MNRLARAARSIRTIIPAIAALAIAAGATFAEEPWRPDPLTPNLGHPGYDTISTTIALDLDIPHGSIVTGSAVIETDISAPLERIGFDLRDGVTVDRVVVDGQPARFRHANDDLTIALPAPAAPGDDLTVEVRYHGMPGSEADPYVRGWWSDGRTIFIIGEPGGAESWFPVNNHPSDAALWRLSLTVPIGFTAIAGGAPGTPVEAGDHVTTTFTYDDPVAPYLLTFAAGDFEVSHTTGPDGVEITLAVPPDLDPATRQVFDAIPDMIAAFTEMFGPYPGKRFGAVVVDGFGGALETEEMVVFGRRAVTPETVAHELSHQWFGNSVRLKTWSDIWLNEAFGRYAELLWVEETGGPIARDALLRDLADSVERQSQAGHGGPVTSPTTETMFSGTTYNRGALALHALRGQMGDEAFFRLLREWNERYRNEAAGTAEFIALASDIAGEDLTPFFDEWLYQSRLPTPLLAPLG